MIKVKDLLTFCEENFNMSSGWLTRYAGKACHCLHIAGRHTVHCKDFTPADVKVSPRYVAALPRSNSKTRQTRHVNHDF
jgi:hypothetical protein